MSKPATKTRAAVAKRATTTRKKRRRRGGSKSRRRCLPADRRQNQGVERLARRDARPCPTLIKQADPEVIEEWKWRGVPVWSHGGIICTGETYKSVVKLTFARARRCRTPRGCPTPASKATPGAPSISPRAAGSMKRRCRR